MFKQRHFATSSNVESSTKIDEISTKIGESTMDLLNMETQKFDENEDLIDSGKKGENEKENLMLMETQNFNESDFNNKTTGVSIIDVIVNTESKTDDVTTMETQQFESVDSKTSTQTDDVIAMETQPFEAAKSDLTKAEPPKNLMALETQVFGDSSEKETSSTKEVEKRKNIFEAETQMFAEDEERDPKPLPEDVEMAEPQVEVDEELIVPVHRYKCGKGEEGEEGKKEEGGNKDEETIDMEAPPVDKTEKDVEAEIESSVEKEDESIFEAETQNLSEVSGIADHKEKEHEPPEERKGEQEDEDGQSDGSEDLLADVDDEEEENRSSVEENPAIEENEEIRANPDEPEEPRATEEEEYEEQYMGATQLFESDESENVVEQIEEQKLKVRID